MVAIALINKIITILMAKITQLMCHEKNKIWNLLVEKIVNLHHGKILLEVNL